MDDELKTGKKCWGGAKKEGERSRNSGMAGIENERMC